VERLMTLADKYREMVGIDPEPFRVLVAVLAHERAKGIGKGPTRKEVADLLYGNNGSVSAAPLLRNGWVKVIGTGPNLPLVATDRAWRNFWPWREGWPPDSPQKLEPTSPQLSEHIQKEPAQCPDSSIPSSLSV
jgi:hypothetical protein